MPRERWTAEKIQDLFREAWEFWGEDPQFNLATEEVGEFLHSLNKYRRKKSSYTKKCLMNEIADVIITLGQIVTAIDIDLFETYYHYKLDRLQEKLICYKEREQLEQI